MEFPVKSCVGVTLVEASLLDKETLTLRRERSTPVPMILFAVALLELCMSLNSALSATS
jgi:hypothetical protein